MTDWSHYYRWGSGAGAVLLVCLGIFAIWNRSLRKQMRRTLAVKKKLREELAFRQAMLDGMPHAIAVRDRDLRLTLCNEAFRRGCSASEDTLLGKKLTELPLGTQNPEVAEAMERRYRKVFDERLPVSGDIDLTFGGKAQKVFHWAAPISLDDGGSPVAVVAGVVDMTQRYDLLELVESARTKAETADRAKSNFLATMSHEIRSPMNAVMGTLELLLRKGHLDAQDKESIELAHGSAKSVLELIDDILDISKIEAGGLEIVPQPTQLRRIVSDVARVFDCLARQRGLSIEVAFDPAISMWHEADPLRFRQIVNNLVSNAIKYTDSGGIRVRLAHAGRTGDVEAISLEVEDTGIGIAAEDVPYLFQAFFQAESAGPRTNGGTGLGLPIVQRLCLKMKGQISVDSEPGRGTCVRVALELPVLAPPVPAILGEPEALPRLRKRGRYNILVVDDHPANRLLLQRQLEHLGFRCAAADNGEAALRMWRDDVFDLVITDCSMPVMDGYQLTAAIRTQEHRRRLPPGPVLGCTAHAQEEDRRHALSVGMDECLIKPVGIDELLQALVRHLPGEGDLLNLASEPSVARQDEPFDAGSLKACSGGDDAVEASFLDALLRTNLSDLIELQALARSGAFRDAAACAHRIKGAAGIVKAGQVVRGCEEIEAAFKSGDREEMAAAVHRLSAALQQLNEAISAQLQSYAVPAP